MELRAKLKNMSESQTDTATRHPSGNGNVADPLKASYKADSHRRQYQDMILRWEIPRKLLHGSIGTLCLILRLFNFHSLLYRIRDTCSVLVKTSQDFSYNLLSLWCTFGCCLCRFAAITTCRVWEHLWKISRTVDGENTCIVTFLFTPKFHTGLLSEKARRYEILNHWVAQMSHFKHATRGSKADYQRCSLVLIRGDFCPKRLSPWYLHLISTPPSFFA